MARAIEVWLVTYAVNALWQVPVITLAACCGAWLLRGQALLSRHRVWVAALWLQVLLPATPSGLGALLAALRRWAANGTRHPGASVSVLQGPGLIDGLTLPARWVHLALLVYGATLAFFSIRLLWNLHRLRILRRHAVNVTLSAPSQEIWEACLRHFGLRRVGLLATSSAASPLTLGLRRATVLVPPALLDTLSAEDQHTLFAHECAHVRRHDFGWNLLYEIAALPVAWHPCLWWTRTRLVESREWVCDDLAITAGTGRHGYARSLLRLATQLLAAAPVKAPHAIGMLDANALERRVMQLTRATKGSGWLARGLAFAGCAVVGLGTVVSLSALRTPVLAAGWQQGDAAPKSVRISGGVMAGNLLSKVNPTYPPDAKTAHVQGSVVLNAVIAKDGTIENLSVVSGPNELQGAAIDAVKQWVYKPFLLNGQPTEVQTTITVNFQLND